MVHTRNVHSKVYYKHVSTSFRCHSVCTCLCYYVRVLNHTINMYIQCSNLYIECCVADVQCTDGYIHFMKCTHIVEQGMYIDISIWMQLFDCPAGWPVGWDSWRHEVLQRVHDLDGSFLARKKLS